MLYGIDSAATRRSLFKPFPPVISPLRQGMIGTPASFAHFSGPLTLGTVKCCSSKLTIVMNGYNINAQSFPGWLV